MSFNKYEEVQLGDVVEEITVGYVGSMTKEYIDYGVPFLRSLNIEPYNINVNSIKYVSSKFHQKLKKSALRQGDVVIVRTGKPGTCAVIPKWIGEVNCSDLVIIRPGENIDSNYLEAYINSMATSHIDAYTVGAVQQHFNVASAKKIKMFLPPLNEQKKIGDISKLVNDKLSTNNKLIDSLEKIASLLFKRWFIDFEFPNEQGLPYLSSGGEMVESELGEIPVNFYLDSIENLASVIDNRGKTPPLVESSDYPIVDVKALGGNSRVIDYSQCRKYVDVETYNSWFRKGHPKELDLLLSTVGSIGEMKLFYGDKGCIAQNVVAFRVDKKKSLYFYEYMKFIKKDLISFNIGSVQPSIKVTHINKVKILLPNEEILSKFNDFIIPINEKIFNLSAEIESLQNMRDILLPKLLSGEIKIPEESVVES